MADSTADASVPLARLARLVLHPVTPHLHTRRLAIVTDATLEYVPMAALPLSDDGVPLIARHDVLRLPAATWLHGQAVRSFSGQGVRVAILADPVFSAGDVRIGERVRLTSTGTPAADAPRHRTGAVPARLAFSGLEADSVTNVAGGATVLKDFRATKASLTALPFDELDVLHLATHAEQHAVRPELSGVVLALVDRHGQPIDGRMRLHEVASLPLSGHLVVLSACQTVIGPRLRGEGLQGLARGFLQAGARMVVASLWDVDDRATMVLMRHFYQALVGDGLEPERALAHAQRAMQRDSRWSDPRYWAGFVVLGAGA